MGEAGWVPFLVSPMGRARWLEGSGTSFGWKGGAKEMESGLLGSRRGAHERPPRWMPVRFGRTFGHAGREKKRKGPSGPLLLFFLLFSAARRPSRRGRGEEKFHRARRRIPAGEMRRWEGAPRGGEHREPLLERFCAHPSPEFSHCLIPPQYPSRPISFFRRRFKVFISECRSSHAHSTRIPVGLASATLPPHPPGST